MPGKGILDLLPTVWNKDNTKQLSREYNTATPQQVSPEVSRQAAFGQLPVTHAQPHSPGVWWEQPAEVVTTAAHTTQTTLPAVPVRRTCVPSSPQIIPFRPPRHELP